MDTRATLQELIDLLSCIGLTKDPEQQRKMQDRVLELSRQIRNETDFTGLKTRSQVTEKIGELSEIESVLRSVDPGGRLQNENAKNLYRLWGMLMALKWVLGERDELKIPNIKLEK